MNLNADVVVLMATYNGERYLREQINSILDQDYKNFLLVIRDDGSKDNTIKIIDSYKDKRIIKLVNNTNQHGQLSNFAELFKFACDKIKFKYLMFSDQDDVWYSTKISSSVQFIESLDSNDVGHVVYTNYDIYNNLTNETREAYTSSLKVSFNKVFVQNWLMGCTMIMDQQFAKTLGNIPFGVENHDYWISIVSSLNNSTFYLNKKTMSHRLHSLNVTTKNNTTTLVGRIHSLIRELSNREKKYNIWHNVERELSDKYSGTEGYKQLVIFNNSKGFQKVKIARKFGFKGLSKKSTILFYLLVFLEKD